MSCDCEEKMKKDIVLINFHLDTIAVPQSLNKRITTLLDKVALTGNAINGAN